MSRQSSRRGGGREGRAFWRWTLGLAGGIVLVTWAGWWSPWARSDARVRVEAPDAPRSQPATQPVPPAPVAPGPSVEPSNGDVGSPARPVVTSPAESGWERPYSPGGAEPDDRDRGRRAAASDGQEGARPRVKVDADALAGSAEEHARRRATNRTGDPRGDRARPPEESGSDGDLD